MWRASTSIHFCLLPFWKGKFLHVTDHFITVTSQWLRHSGCRYVTVVTSIPSGSGCFWSRVVFMYFAVCGCFSLKPPLCLPPRMWKTNSTLAGWARRRVRRFKKNLASRQRAYRRWFNMWRTPRILQELRWEIEAVDEMEIDKMIFYARHIGWRELDRSHQSQ